MGDGGLGRPDNFFKTYSSSNPSEASRNWTSWLQQFDYYMIASEKNEKTEEIQIATLLHCLGIEGQELFRTFTFETAGDEKKIATVKTKFTEYFAPRVREEFERYKYYSRSQGRNESFDSFLTALQGLIQTCNFHADEKDKALRDRVVIGINSESVREELLNVDEKLTLKKCIQICQRSEATKLYLSQMTASNQAETSGIKQAANAIAPGHAGRPPDNNKTRNNCKYCGYTHAPRQCPAFGKECTKCKKPNHFAKVCQSKPGKNFPLAKSIDEIVPNSAADEVTNQGQYTTSDMGFEVTADDSPREWFITARCGNQDIKLKVDTGATCNVMPQSVFLSLKRPKTELRKYHDKLSAYGGHNLSVLGKVSLMLEYKSTFSVHDFVVVEQGMSTLLGLPSCITMSLVEAACAISKNTIVAQYTDVFEGLGTLPSKHALRLKDDSKPVVQSARRVPFRIRDKLKATLESMESEGTITRVRTPTDWVHPIVNVLKPNGSLRVCLDPTELNKCIRREHFALPTAPEIFAKLTGSKVFSTLDATSGFLQLELDEDSSFLTTFATPFGRWRFLRLPYGISSAPEVFHRTVNEIFADIEGVETYVDDLLVHAPTKAEHDTILRRVLERCKEVNLRLNLKKCVFEQDELKYLGHIIGQGVIKPDPSKIEAVVKMPHPESPEDLRRILGMATYLAKFCPNLSEITAPLRDLTKKGTVWVWGYREEAALKALKAMMVDSKTLRIFDPGLPVTLSVDSSKSGMGATIMQDGQPIEYASCSLTDTQKAYAQIEKEFLAVQYGLHRFHQYIFGQKVVVETDHLPLLGIMKKGLNDMTPRLLRMRLRNTRYDYELTYKPGTKLFIADTLSRAYLDRFSENHASTAQDHDQIHAVTTGTLANPLFRESFTEATIKDPSMQILKSYIVNGWPVRKGACIEPLKAYWKIRHDLTTHDDVILRGNQLVVPLAMKEKVIKEIHTGHLGIAKCIERAKNAVYWPGYQSQIREIIETCATCQENARSNAKTMLEPYNIPDHPMQTVSMDIFHLGGRDYFLTVDRYSKWPTCHELKYSTSREIIELLRQQFLDFGRPETIISDNASYFVSNEFQCFVDECNTKHITTSPYYSQSNGLAERMNQTVKTCLDKALKSNQTLHDVLATLRSTPAGDGLPSPSVLLQGRNLRSALNCMPAQLRSQQVSHQEIVGIFEKRQAQSQYYNSPHQNHREYVEGMNIWVKQGHRNWVEGYILRRAETPRSFYVKLQDGRVFRRNQSFFRVRKRPINSGHVETPSPAVESQSTTHVPHGMQTTGGTAVRMLQPEARVSSSAGHDAGSAATPGNRRSTRVSEPPVTYGQNIYSRKCETPSSGS